MKRSSMGNEQRRQEELIGREGGPEIGDASDGLELSFVERLVMDGRTADGVKGSQAELFVDGEEFFAVEKLIFRQSISPR
jgi:hypothetical protein